MSPELSDSTPTPVRSDEQQDETPTRVRSDEQHGQPRRPGWSAGGGWRLLFWLFLLILVGPSLLRLLGIGQQFAPIDYSAFRELVAEGRVAQVTVRGDRIRGHLAGTGETDGPGDDRQTGRRGASEPASAEAIPEGRFETYLPSFGDTELLAMLEERDVQVRTEPQADGWWQTLLVSALPLLLLVGLGVLLVRRVQSQGQGIFSMGANRAKLYQRRDESTTFDDIAGADGAKRELEEIIAYLEEPRRFQRIGGEPPKGVLLVGPPGTGKTLLARACAGTAGVPFFQITGSDFMEMFVGVGASRVRNLFKDARRAAPSIVFIDELDSIGRRRGAGLGGGHDEREQTLNQLLSEMDGFDARHGVIVMAATNRPDILDAALLRPGRFDRHVTVELPTTRARRAILELHARNKPLAGDVDFEEMARATPGFAGADLANLLNEAALLAARKHKDAIESEEVEEARDKIMLGMAREGLSLGEEEIRLLAYHEGGHAVVAGILPHADPVHKVSIVPRGRSMGATQQLPDKDKYIYSEEYILDRIAVMLGGRAAERLVLDTTTSGSENDLRQVTRMARKMVLDWGMTDRLGQLALGQEHEHVFLGSEIAQQRNYSEATAREIDEEVRRIVDEAFERATNVLRKNRDALDEIAQALEQDEEIPGDRVLEVLERHAAA